MIERTMPRRCSRKKRKKRRGKYKVKMEEKR